MSNQTTTQCMSTPCRQYNQENWAFSTGGSMGFKWYRWFFHSIVLLLHTVGCLNSRQEILNLPNLSGLKFSSWFQITFNKSSGPQNRALIFNRPTDNSTSATAIATFARTYLNINRGYRENWCDLKEEWDSTRLSAMQLIGFCAGDKKTMGEQIAEADSPKAEACLECKKVQVLLSCFPFYKCSLEGQSDY